jgi:GWxTD domain-containing protein
MPASSYYFIKKLSCLLALAIAATAPPLFVGRGLGQYPSPVPVAPPETPSPGISPTRPRFSADATVQPGEAGAPEVRIDYRLARSELLFERTPTGYRAAYEIRVIFSTEKGKKEVAGDAYTRELRVRGYSETQQGNDIVDHVTFRMPPGRYLVEIAITDLNAERPSSTTLPIEVPGIAEGQIWLTDLYFGTTGGDSTGSTGQRAVLIPNPSRSFGEDLPRFAAGGEIVDNRPAGAPDSAYQLSYRVLNDLQTVVARGDTSMARRGPRTPFLIRPGLGPLESGTYRFVLELSSPLSPATDKKKKPTPIRREKSFTVVPSAASATADIKTALEVLRYIATEAEITEMDRLRTPEERQRFWEVFWKSRDPSPETTRNEAMEEFYKRVRYADQRFGVGGPGWKTDMGRIYIQFSQPDEIVRNPFRFDGPPEEIWYYYQSRRTFVFVDRDGFGRYELDLERSR